MLPAKLVDFTSPIVENALKTGARGKTETTTNYGVVGDAMFKKAQLDLGIAELKGNMGMKEAELMSGLEMHGAEINFGMAKAKMDSNLKLQDMKMQLEQNEVGFFEALLNDVAGAVSGAATGFMVGGPVGAVVGGVAGGVATAGAQMSGGRRGAQGAQQALGTIANGASMIKGISAANKADDAWKTWSDRAQTLSGMLQNPNAGPDERMQAMQQMDTHMNAGFGVLTNDMKMNPQAAAETMNSVRSVFSGTSENSADRAKDFHMNTMQQAVEAQADNRFDDPGQSRQALKEFMARSQKNYAMAYGGKAMPPELLDSMVVDAGLTQRKGIMDMNGDQKAGAQVTSRNLSPEHVSPADLAPESLNQTMTKNRGRSVQQAPPAYSAPVQQDQGRAWHAPMARGAGVEMDDGGPAAAEQQLAKQGAEAVKVLGDDEQAPGEVPRSLGDRLLHGGKVPVLGKVPGIIDDKGGEVDESNEQARKDYANRRDWEAEIQEKPEEDRPFFTERDPRKIQKAYNVQDMDQVTDKETKGKVEGATAAAAQLNKIRDDITDLGEMKGVDREVLKDYQLWKSGTYGDEGMKGESKGVSAKGIGVSWGSFEKSTRLSLEGKGVKGKAQDQVIQQLRKVDAQLGPLAQSMAVAKQGSRPSDADVKAYSDTLANLMDPNPDNSIAGLVEMQDLILTDFKSLLGNTPSRDTMLSRNREQSASKRMSAEDVAARRAPPRGRRKKSYYETLIEGN